MRLNLAAIDHAAHERGLEAELKTSGALGYFLYVHCSEWECCFFPSGNILAQVRASRLETLETQAGRAKGVLNALLRAGRGLPEAEPWPTEIPF